MMTSRGLDDATAFPAEHRAARRRRLTRRLVLAALIAVLLVAVLHATPWPAALLIRGVFAQGAAGTVAEMAPYVPSSGVDDLGTVAYAEGSPDTTLSAYSRSGSGPLPTVVWIHGGAWISGDSGNVDPYLQLLAAEGYTAIGLNYTVGPEAVYPTAVGQLNDALAYITAHAGELRVDPTRIVLAGDSAGAQLASQLAVLTTNPEYSRLLGIEPALDPRQLIGVVLNCGVYDLDRMADLSGIVAWGFDASLWAYTGTKDWSATYEGATMSTIDFVTPDFPPTYISGGNGDGLTWLQSVPMAEALRAQDVEVTELFWAEDHEPALPHEYQFHLDYPEAKQALQETLDFLAVVSTR
jgi:acetyl esterase/lipase